MKTTIKEFKKALETKKHTFLGTTRKNYTMDELECILADFLAENKRGIANVREAVKVQTNAICFTGNSWLYFDNKCNKKIVEKQEYSDGILYVFSEYGTYSDGMEWNIHSVYYIYK